MDELEEINVRELLFKTTCAGGIGIAGAEALRAVFHYLHFKHTASGSWYFNLLHDCIHSALSAFILIVISYEKALLLGAGMRGTYFLLTFFLCILFSRIFSSSSPSPCFPLQKNWAKIQRAGIVLDRRRQTARRSYSITSLLEMVKMYLQVATPFILGQILGLVIAINWLKIYWNWDGWVTSHHLTNLPILDDCLPSLNTSLWKAFAIETTITFVLLSFYEYIDNLTLSHDGANKLMQSFLMRNCLKSGLVIASMYIFLDVTGSYANPFHAISMQRHCLTHVEVTSKILFVYLIGPFIGTVAFLLVYGGEGRKKAKQSV